MIGYAELTKRGQTVVGILGVSAIVAMIGISGAIETQSTPATIRLAPLQLSAYCDQMNNAVWELDWRLGDNIAEDILIEKLKDMSCPWEDSVL